jgi:hypothetical protein
VASKAGRRRGCARAAGRRLPFLRLPHRRGFRPRLSLTRGRWKAAVAGKFPVHAPGVGGMVGAAARPPSGHGLACSGRGSAGHEVPGARPCLSRLLRRGSRGFCGSRCGWCGRFSFQSLWDASVKRVLQPSVCTWLSQSGPLPACVPPPPGTASSVRWESARYCVAPGWLTVARASRGNLLGKFCSSGF